MTHRERKKANQHAPCYSSRCRLTNASRLMCTGLPIRGGRVIDRVVGGSRHHRESHIHKRDRKKGARVHECCWKEKDRSSIKRRTRTRLHDSPYPDNYHATGMPVRNRALRTNTNASLASLLLGRTTRSSRPTSSAPSPLIVVRKKKSKRSSNIL